VSLYRVCSSWKKMKVRSTTLSTFATLLIISPSEAPHYLCPYSMTERWKRSLGKLGKSRFRTCSSWGPTWRCLVSANHESRSGQDKSFSASKLEDNCKTSSSGMTRLVIGGILKDLEIFPTLLQLPTPLARRRRLIRKRP
jgi:hypothetical protein